MLKFVCQFKVYLKTLRKFLGKVFSMDNIFYIGAEILGILIFLGICFAMSKKKKDIPWLSVGILVALNIAIALFFLNTPIGQSAVTAASDGFSLLISGAQEGIAFAFGTSLTNYADNSAVFFASALLPVLVIVPLFDILTYFGILPWIIKIIGKAIAFITRTPKFESFFAIEMMFLGNTEAIAASRFQILKLSKERILTVAMMSMSCISAALVGSYTSMMPGAYVLTAIPLNVINALLVATIMNPYKLDKSEDEIATLYKKGEKKEPFFSYLGNSILGSGKLVLIICANVIAFVGLAAVINIILGAFNPLIHNFVNWDLSLQNLFGLIMYIPAVLLGLPIGAPETMEMAQSMGTKLVTNEFVVMGNLQPILDSFNSEHFKCVVTIFLTSFANFSTIGMIVGCFQGMVGEDKNKHIAKNILYMFVAGILVSCLSAGIAGLFVW